MPAAAYAIVQKEMLLPDVEQLKRAFSISPLLTAIDAQTAVNDAYGILLRGQQLDQAMALQEALRLENVDTELVEESKLPVIPPAHVVHQMEFQPTHLTLIDPMKRAAQVPWEDLMFIAVGDVRGPTTRDEEPHHLLLDLFLKDGKRYSANGDDFVFDRVGSRTSEDPCMNFLFLVQDLSEEAPNAGLNQGGVKACQRPPQLFLYPTKSAYNEEMIWMLWRISRMTNPA